MEDLQDFMAGPLPRKSWEQEEEMGDEIKLEIWADYL